MKQRIDMSVMWTMVAVAIDVKRIEAVLVTVSARQATRQIKVEIAKVHIIITHIHRHTFKHSSNTHRVTSQIRDSLR